MSSKKFAIVRLSEEVEPRENPYIIVPSFWVKSENDGSIKVPYPSGDQLPIEFERIVSCQPAMAEWKDYSGVIEREADSYEAALLYVKRRDDRPLDEEQLLLWRRISLEFITKLRYIQPTTILYQLWTQFWNLKNKLLKN